MNKVVRITVSLILMALVCVASADERDRVVDLSEGEKVELEVHPAEPQIEYQTIWVEGESWVVGVTDELAVAMHLTLGNPLDLHIVVLNTGTDQVLFDPEMVIAFGRLASNDSPVPFEVWPPAHSKARIRSRESSRAMGLAFANALRSTSRALDSTMTRAERELLDEHNADRLRAERDHMLRSAEFQADLVAEKHTIFPGAAYAGHVYIKSAKLRKLRLAEFVFRIAETEFKSTFTID